MLIFNELNSALYAPIPKDIYTASLIINKNGCCFMQLLDFTIYQHKTLHPSSIPWNPLCLSGFQRVNGTIPPFITLHSRW